MTRGFLVVADRCFGCGSCAMACRAWSGDGWALILELNSRSEGRAIWVPYLCSQAVPDPPCGFRGAVPPCELACPTRAIQYCDLDALRPGARARPLPTSPGAPGVRYVGDIPGDVELPDPRDVLPVRRRTTENAIGGERGLGPSS